MSKRIRYDKVNENTLVSRAIYTSLKTGAQYRVTLMLDTMTYKIKNVNSENIYVGGEGLTNINVLKRSAKRRLEGLGVSFDCEVRNRTFGICPKGHTQVQENQKNK